MGKSKVQDPKELARLWQERCAAGTFSAGVQGVGTIRVMGNSGDTPVAFPRIESLSALGTLEADEIWAVEEAKKIFEAARAQNRPVMRVDPGAAQQVERVANFDPQAADLVVGIIISGG
jgi:hypothetical protein